MSAMMRVTLILLLADVVASFSRNSLRIASSSFTSLTSFTSFTSVTLKAVTDSPLTTDEVVKKKDDEVISTVLVNALIKSPLYAPIVTMAKNTMKKTALSIGIDWKEKANSLRKANSNWDTQIEEIIAEKGPSFVVPSYYIQPFHGYKEGNLCLDAGLEQEIAGKAVGVRNFPDKGKDAEEFLRRAFEIQIENMGGKVLPDRAVCVDFGCGTGTSTRRLAKMFPTASKIIGIDLSPYMLAIGKFLLEEISEKKEEKDENEGNNDVNIVHSSYSTEDDSSNNMKSNRNDKNSRNSKINSEITKFEWVDKIEEDDRIEFQYGDMAETGLQSVLHELPQHATVSVLKEAHRILAPGGTVVISEMDPSAPGYQKLQRTPWLYAILKSTEPYLEEYFNMAPLLQSTLKDIGFSVVRTGAATGRHLTIVGIKEGTQDLRPSPEERLASDEHLKSLSTQSEKTKKNSFDLSSIFQKK